MYCLHSKFKNFKYRVLKIYVFGTNFINFFLQI